MKNKHLYLGEKAVSSVNSKIKALTDMNIKANHSKENAGAGKCSSSGNCMAYA